MNWMTSAKNRVFQSKRKMDNKSRKIGKYRFKSVSPPHSKSEKPISSYSLTQLAEDIESNYRSKPSLAISGMKSSAVAKTDKKSTGDMHKQDRIRVISKKDSQYELETPSDSSSIGEAR